MPATARIEMRCDPHEKMLLERAAALKGMKTTAFVREQAVAQAKQVIKEAERIEVSEKGYQQILKLLDNPPAPTKALLAAMRAHRAAGL
jgi:uncharacterized protein (DUF1778 family)